MNLSAASAAIGAPPVITLSSLPKLYLFASSDLAITTTTGGAAVITVVPLLSAAPKMSPSTLLPPITTSVSPIARPFSAKKNPKE